MNKRFIKLGNKIFCLEEISSAHLEEYDSAPPNLELVMNNGDAFSLFADEAQTIWDLLCASALQLVK